MKCIKCGQKCHEQMCNDCLLKLASSAMGRKGGLATAKRGSAYFSEIGKKGMAKRWAKTS